MLTQFEPVTHESVMELYEPEIDTLVGHLRRYSRAYGYTSTKEDGVEVYNVKGDFMFEIPTPNTKSAHILLLSIVDKAKSIVYAKR